MKQSKADIIGELTSLCERINNSRDGIDTSQFEIRGFMCEIGQHVGFVHWDGLTKEHLTMILKNLRDSLKESYTTRPSGDSEEIAFFVVGARINADGTTVGCLKLLPEANVYLDITPEKFEMFYPVSRK